MLPGLYLALASAPKKRTAIDIQLIQKAWRTAERAHRGQTYGSAGSPYLLHLGQVMLEAVAATAQLDGERTEIIISAILHDTLEDTEVTEHYLADHFGTEVLRIVRALTKDDALPKAEQMPDSLRRIKACGQPAAVVKLCDRIANLSQAPPDHWEVAWIRAYRAEGERIHRELGAYAPALAERLREVLIAYERFCTE